MAVGLKEPENILPVRGVRLSAVSCGIKSNGKEDLVMIELQEGSICAAVFTKNAFSAAPVLIAKEHLAASSPRVLLINSGNANAGLGAQGIKNARQCCEIVAEKTGCRADQVLPFSTGVIGEPLPMDAVRKGIDMAGKDLSEDKWLSASRGIMTTDTVAKAISKQVDIEGSQVTITGVAKGSGMICPNMATMLAFIATDAKVELHFLQQCLDKVVENSFNAITVDGDTSTNDACVLMATGNYPGKAVDKDSKAAEAFTRALEEVCVHLAQTIVRDGEGATKFITVITRTALTREEARSVSYAIAQSPLVKTALFASDPNWGRILAAVGNAGIEHMDIDKVNIFLDDLCIVSGGARDQAYREEAGAAVMRQSEITITVELNRGHDEAVVWTTDLSHEYVTINSEYRS